MAKTDYERPTRVLHGKTHKDEKGYHYQTSDGRTHYRDRKETYQKNQSPRQIWNSQAFAYAHTQLPAFCTELTMPTTEAAWKTAKREDITAKNYADAKRWKFADLQREWKLAHPFEEWYTEHLDQISAKIAAKTAAENISDFMINSKIADLQTQIAQLQALLKQSHSQHTSSC